MCTTQLIEFLD